MFCYFFFVAQMAHPSSHSPSLLWTHFMPLFLHLLFVCCRTVPASEFHPSSKPTNHDTPTEVPCDPHYLPVSSVCLCVYDFVCVCVYRVFPHLASELCFSSGPFPCSVNPPPLLLHPCSSRLPSSLSRRFLYERDRKLAFSVSAHVSWLPRVAV